QHGGYPAHGVAAGYLRYLLPGGRVAGLGQFIQSLHQAGENEEEAPRRAASQRSSASSRPASSTSQGRKSSSRKAGLAALAAPSLGA
nr:hypothetical protein [Tanacetum cinerariifolium]